MSINPIEVVGDAISSDVLHDGRRPRLVCVAPILDLVLSLKRRRTTGSLFGLQPIFVDRAADQAEPIWAITRTIIQVPTVPIGNAGVGNRELRIVDEILATDFRIRNDASAFNADW